MFSEASQVCIEFCLIKSIRIKNIDKRNIQKLHIEKQKKTYFFSIESIKIPVRVFALWRQISIYLSFTTWALNATVFTESRTNIFLKGHYSKYGMIKINLLSILFVLGAVKCFTY